MRSPQLRQYDSSGSKWTILLQDGQVVEPNSRLLAVLDICSFEPVPSSFPRVPQKKIGGNRKKISSGKPGISTQSTIIRMVRITLTADIRYHRFISSVNSLGDFLAFTNFLELHRDALRFY